MRKITSNESKKIQFAQYDISNDHNLENPSLLEDYFVELFAFLIFMWNPLFTLMFENLTDAFWESRLIVPKMPRWGEFQSIWQCDFARLLKTSANVFDSNYESFISVRRIISILDKLLLEAKIILHNQATGRAWRNINSNLKFLGSWLSNKTEENVCLRKHLSVLKC